MDKNLSCGLVYKRTNIADTPKCLQRSVTADVFAHC